MKYGPPAGTTPLVAMALILIAVSMVCRVHPSKCTADRAPKGPEKEKKKNEKHSMVSTSTLVGASIEMAKSRGCLDRFGAFHFH